MEQQQSPQLLRKRKFLLMLPVLMLPFVIMIFWALGGGKGGTNQPKVAQQKGFNTKLPDPHLKVEETDKMAYYQRAAQDSLADKERKRNEQLYNDQLGTLNNKNNTGDQSGEDEDEIPPAKGYNKNRNANAGHAYQVPRDRNEERVYRKLDQLNEALNRASQPSGTTSSAPAMAATTAPAANRDIERLEKMMNMIKPDQSEQNKDMEQIGGVLDKILAVQHPDLYRDDSLKNYSISHKRAVLPVSTVDDSAPVTYLTRDLYLQHDTAKTDKASVNQALKTAARYGEVGATVPGANILEAIVPTDQTLVAGGTLAIALLDEAFIGGIKIAAGTPIYGKVSLSGDRLRTTISSIRYGKHIFPVSLELYDQDGLAGIYVPGAITRDAVKQGADQGISSIGMTSLDPSLAGQATGAGIEIAKTVIGKKIKLVRVSIKSGYRVLLKDSEQN